MYNDILSRMQHVRHVVRIIPDVWFLLYTYLIPVLSVHALTLH
jgi:hypothetical protein